VSSKTKPKSKTIMKNLNLQITGRICQFGLAALLTTGLTTQAQTTLYSGHTDVGIAYDQDANQWELHVHDEENATEYFPATDALLFVKNEATTTVPAGSQWSFLGSEGSSTWTLPQTQNEDLLFLGIGAEEIESGIFSGDSLTLTLQNVSGPGQFALYDVDSFGTPIVQWNSADGFGDELTVETGGHSHFNWAFSEPGDYTLTIEASGISTLNGATSSGGVNYLFQVQAVPEPSTMALGGLGVLAVLLVRRRKGN
jgi:surface-anchored protein